MWDAQRRLQRENNHKVIYNASLISSTQNLSFCTDRQIASTRKLHNGGLRQIYILLNSKFNPRNLNFANMEFMIEILVATEIITWVTFVNCYVKVFLQTYGAHTRNIKQILVCVCTRRQEFWYPWKPLLRRFTISWVIVQTEERSVFVRATAFS